MKFPEHLTLSYLLAHLGVQQQFGTAGTVLMIVAGNLPDLDTVTLLGGWQFYRRYHRIVGHGLPVTICGPAFLAGIGYFCGLGVFWPLWLWLQIALLVHLAADISFYRWPVQIFWPVSSRGFGLGLVSWNDLVPTLTLYLATAVSLIWTGAAFWCSILTLGLLISYLAWKAFQPPDPQLGGRTWLTGGWAEDSSRFWRWLTGDFIT